MDKSVNRFLAGAGLALLLCGTGASGQAYGPPPATIAEAHEFLGNTFKRYSIGYVVWHGRGQSDNHQGRAGYYGGRDCFSEVGSGLSSREFAVDWSLISRVDMSGLEAIYVSGQLMPASQNAGARREANFHLYFPDATVARSVANAFEILRSSCKRRSRFD